ncbi:MAG: CRISPR-associated endonuclease Cas2 [Leptospiraceae bacterium]|nr:CRISPR-associated endonuclease Cas2 [Leptospiraceae bacterium]MCP5503231.1 CRISPR-associated endonuclease Cas2 [Leptospiraceae bacterium]
MTEKTYLFCYDIPSDKEGNRRRTKLMKLLEKNGIRVQYSIFEIRLEKDEELNELLNAVQNIVSKKQDSIRIYPLYTDVMKNLILIGQANLYKEPNEYIF